MYREIRIHRLHAVLWVNAPEAVDAQPSTATITPDGCMDLLATGSGVVIAGADTAARTVPATGETIAGLRFDSGVLPQLLATSAAELADRLTPLAEVAPPQRVRSPGARLAEATSPSVRVRSLLGLAEDLLARTEIDRRPLALADALAARGDGSSVSIAEAAADFAYSPRQLRRLSAQWYGYGPKHLAKILRWRRARALIDAGLTRTEAAARSGYSDAAHLWREERALLGR